MLHPVILERQKEERQRKEDALWYRQPALEAPVPKSVYQEQPKSERGSVEIDYRI